MKAMNLARRERALRFAGWGLIVGIGLGLGELITFNAFLLLVQHQFFPSSGRELLSLIIWTIVFLSTFSLVGLFIGAATVRFSARMWGWRLFGGATILLGIIVFVMALMIATPDVYGWAVLIFLVVSSIGFGIIMILRSKGATIDRL
jgi:hypothetical protein